MTEESVPQQGGPSSGRPKGLLQQMEELMAALNAELSSLQEEAGIPALDSQEHVRGSAPDLGCAGG
ncbi:hypothetical protein AB0D74_20995 [Streptomyces sp. NPDC048278]|uniref:hypothetical protein n=1 Tax=Streptomyces sp. NPDC048278 TaxID=3155809 RepID=UPI00343CFAE5